MRKKILKRLCALTMSSIFLFSAVCYSAIITDNDSDAFITKSEFEALKNNIQGQIDAYNNNLDNAIDDAITAVLVDLDGGSGVKDEFYDSIYPVGTVIISNEHPNFGEWTLLSSSTDSALWLSSGASWGQIIEQALPLPIINLTASTHNHTFTGTQVTTSTSSNHTHQFDMGIITVNMGANGLSGVIYPDKIGTTTRTSGSSGDHKHSFTPSGTISVDKHTHTLPAVNEAIYKGTSTEIKPDLYFIKMWQRIR